MEQLQTFRSETAFHFIALVIGVEYVQLMSIADTFRYIRKVFNTARHVRQYNTMEQTRTAFQSHINDTAVEQPVPAAVTEYFIQILDVVCIVLSVARNNYIKILLNHFSVMVECTKTQRLPIVQEMVLPNITKPFKSDLSFLVDCMQQPNVPVVDVIHKTTPYNSFNYLNISIINEMCKKFAYLFCTIFSL